MPKSNDDSNTCRNARFGQEFGAAVGRLDIHNPRTSSGKKVMTWDFRPLGTDKAYSVEVAYLLDENGGMYFRASSTELGLALENSDIEALRRAVEAELMLLSADIRAMKWEDWLQVSVSGSGSRFNANSFTGMGAELKIHVQRLKRGWHEATQRYVTIGQSGFVQAFPQPTAFKERAEEDGPDLEWLTGSGGSQKAYIPDTPENLAALRDIQARLGALQDRLMALLHQDAIGESLGQPDTLFLPQPTS